MVLGEGHGKENVSGNRTVNRIYWLAFRSQSPKPLVQWLIDVAAA